MSVLCEIVTSTSNWENPCVWTCSRALRYAKKIHHTIFIPKYQLKYHCFQQILLKKAFIKIWAALKSEMRIQYLGSDSNNLQIRNVSLWIFWPFEKILFGGWVIQIQRQLIKCVFRYGFPNCCINCIHISLIFGGFLYKFLIKSEKFLVF